MGRQLGLVRPFLERHPRVVVARPARVCRWRLVILVVMGAESKQHVGDIVGVELALTKQ